MFNKALEINCMSERKGANGGLLFLMLLRVWLAVVIFVRVVGELMRSVKGIVCVSFGFQTAIGELSVSLVMSCCMGD